MALHITLSEVNATTVAASTLPDALTTIQVNRPSVTAAEYVDHNGNVIDVTPIVGDNVANFVKYCDYPGIRLLERTSFQVNGNPLDEYSSNTANVYQQFGIPEDKRQAFNTIVGQENKIDGFLQLS